MSIWWMLTQSLQTPDEVARLIANEMRSEMCTRIGNRMVLQDARIEPYSTTSALCWLTFDFCPLPGSELGGKGWTFTNVYQYRAATAGVDAGWESILRDQEINKFQKATGQSFTA